MKIYVANLTAYANSKLAGFWYDPSEDNFDKDALLERITTEFGEGAEWAIHDYDGFKSHGEHPDLDKLLEFMQAMDEVEADLTAAFEAWHDNDPTYNTSLDDFRDAYGGSGSSKADWAQGFYEDTAGTPKKNDEFASLYPYVDWERYARDMEMGGDVWFFEESFDIVHAFWNR